MITIIMNLTKQSNTSKQLAASETDRPRPCEAELSSAAQAALRGKHTNHLLLVL